MRGRCCEVGKRSPPECRLPGYGSTLVRMVAKWPSAPPTMPIPERTRRLTTDQVRGGASADVIAARRTADAQAEYLGAAIDAQIEVALASCRIAQDAHATKQADLADHSDLDLDGDTRWAARRPPGLLGFELAGAGIETAHGAGARDTPGSQRRAVQADAA